MANQIQRELEEWLTISNFLFRTLPPVLMSPKTDLYFVYERCVAALR